MKIYRTLMEYSPSNKMLRGLGEAVNRCSGAYFRLKKYDSFFLLLEEGIEIFRELSAIDPDEYRLTVGCLLGNLCSYYQETVPDKEKAIAAARESCRILDEYELEGDVKLLYSNMKEFLDQE